MTDVNDLLARLRNTSASSAASHEAMSLLQNPELPSAGEPASTASVSTPPPVGMASDRAANLLNLLKFNNSSSNASPSPLRLASQTGQVPGASATGSPQDALLKLLNSRNPSLSVRPQNAIDSANNESDRSSVLHPSSEPSAPTKTSPFGCVNPFNDLSATAPTASSGNGTHKNGALPLHSNGSVAKRPSPVPSPLPDGRTPLEALMGIGATAKDADTVSKTLQEVGEKANVEATDALSRVESSTSKALDRKPHQVHNAMQEAAKEIKEEMKDEEIRAAFQEGMPTPMAEAFQATIDQVANGEDIADSWESADAGEISRDVDGQASDEIFDTTIFDFPMKPFVTINVQGDAPPTAGVRDDVVMKIASLKREFDQVDRTLAAATNNHIVYAMAKGGGFRVIRQDDGSNKHLFRKSGNQIFNLGIASSTGGKAEPVLATGMNGSVYWTEVPVSGTVPLAEFDGTTQSFQFPPLPSQDDNTSGAQLKTRAKLSNKHSEFFAIGRGKSIYIIWPKLAMLPQYCDPTSRVVDTEKYLSERSLKIATGKAGKDFAFSQDDSIIVSLDKAGRLKFWDIQDHTDPDIATSSTIPRHVDVKVPLMILATSSPDKSWATSVQFIDKDRPFSKGSALRYLLVGSRQNHVITLWDLALGKPVQEVVFPQETETDPICSISYHAKTGHVIVGHPKRNSLYIITLSAPRYNLSHMTQALFIDRLAKRDSTLPKPDATAIMSSLREISLDSVGQLRSLEISGPVPTNDQDDDTVLEVYLMHSLGVTCLNLKKEDLGLGKDGKPVNPVNAEKSNKIKVEALRALPAFEGSDLGSEPGKKVSETGRNDTPSSKKAEASPKKLENASTNGKTQVSSSASTLPTASQSAASAIAPSPLKNGTSETPTASEVKLKTKAPSSANASSTATEAKRETIDVGATGQSNTLTSEDFASRISGTLGQTIATSMGGVLSRTFGEVLGDQLEKLYRRIDEDKRVSDAAGAAKQDAVLRLVSSTLTNNVEKSLAQIVNRSIQDSVVPSINTVVSKSIDKSISDTVAKQLQTALTKELKSALAPAISRAMQDPIMLRGVSDAVTAKISTHVEEVFAASLRNSIAPSFHKLAEESARSMGDDLEKRVREQLHTIELQRSEDGVQVAQLTSLTNEMLREMKAMVQEQNALRSELKLMRAEAQVVAPAPQTRATQGTLGDADLDRVASYMANGQRYDGTLAVSILHENLLSLHILISKLVAAHESPCRNVRQDLCKHRSRLHPRVESSDHLLGRRRAHRVAGFEH